MANIRNVFEKVFTSLVIVIAIVCIGKGACATVQTISDSIRLRDIADGYNRLVVEGQTRFASGGALGGFSFVPIEADKPNALLITSAAERALNADALEFRFRKGYSHPYLSPLKSIGVTCDEKYVEYIHADPMYFYSCKIYGLSGWGNFTPFYDSLWIFLFYLGSAAIIIAALYALRRWVLWLAK